MDPGGTWCTVVDFASVVTAVAALIAAIYSAVQARSTAKVNAATLASLKAEEERRRQEVEQRLEDARVGEWLAPRLRGGNVAHEEVANATGKDAEYFKRALVERRLVRDPLHGFFRWTPEHPR